MKKTSTDSYHRLFYHITWSTKNQEPLITSSIEKALILYLKTKAKELNTELIEINNVADHVHLLIRLSPMDSISEVVKSLKGSSSHYLSKKLGIDIAFEWQAGYGAFTVGSSEIFRIQEYIQRQKEHHKEGTIIDELEGMGLME